MSARALGIIGWRGLLLVASFAAVLQVSIGGTFADSSPTLALAWTPWNAIARTNLAALLVSGDPSVQAKAAARSLALDALRRDAVSPAALRVLALTRQAAGQAEDPQTLSLMNLSERLSRRDAQTQIWLVQHFTMRGDIPQLMRHFDIALRTSEAARDKLFPLIEATAADPRVRLALVARLRERPIWALPFAAHVIDQESDPHLMAALTSSWLNPSSPDEMGLIRSLLERLTTIGDAEVAAEVYSRYGFGRSGRAAGLNVNNGDFEGRDGLPPFAWILGDQPDLWAARQNGPSGGKVLRLGASSGQSGEVARQLLQLLPGTYRLTARVGDVPTDKFGRPQVKLACASKNAPDPLLSAAPATGQAAAQDLSASFTVPAGCRYQWLTLAVADVGTHDNDGPWVDDIRISQARQ